MTTQPNQTVVTLERVRIWNHNIRLWTGRKKLQVKDLHVDAGDLPPKDLATLGAKKICNPEDLAVFGTLKKRFVTLMEQYGVKFLGGYAIPESKTKELLPEVVEIMEEGQKAKAEFLDKYQVVINAWVDKHPQWRDSILDAVTPQAIVESRIHFGFTTYQIKGLDTADAPESEGLNEAASTLGDRLLEEIASSAEDLFERSVLGRDSLNRRILQPIRALRNKLDGLSFLDPVVVPIVQSIDATLAKMPSDGPIAGADLSALQGLLLILADDDRAREHGKAILAGDKATEDFASEAAIDPDPVPQLPVQPELFAPPAAIAVAPASQVNPVTPPSLFQGMEPQTEATVTQSRQLPIRRPIRVNG